MKPEECNIKTLLKSHSTSVNTHLCPISLFVYVCIVSFILIYFIITIILIILIFFMVEGV